MSEKGNKILIPIAIVIAGLLIAGSFLYINKTKTPQENILSPQAAAEKAISFINQNMLEEGLAAVLVSVKEESDIYKFKLKIGDEEYDCYVTKDGKILFIQAINLEEIVESQSSPPETEYSEEKLEALAKCLQESGAKFYGAYNCPWCQRQKEMFGEADKYLPFIECSPDRASEAELTQCREANVGPIPDWRFPDGKQELGLQSLEKLAELSGCPF